MERMTSYFTPKASSTYRPKLPPLTSRGSSEHDINAAPSTPLLRTLNSPLNSPGVAFRPDDDTFVFEIGARYLRAGIGGEARPRCVTDFGPRTQGRAGDYALALPERRVKRRRVTTYDDWGRDDELWRNDVRHVDLALLGDRVERAIRRALTEQVLVLDDSKKRRIVLALPSSLPLPLLATLLKTVFGMCPPPPSVTLLSSPLLCCVAAGLRSALVVDIGWEETVVSAVYEYREVLHRQSARAVRMLSWELYRLLNREAKTQGLNTASMKTDGHAFDFDDTEEVMMRMLWCRKATTTTTTSSSDPIAIPIPYTNPQETLTLPFMQPSEPVENIFFAPATTNPDDHEQPLHRLLHSTLLALPIDIRRTCLPRIIFTGGGSNIPGLKARLLAELNTIISQQSWDPVHSYGSAKHPKTRLHIRTRLLSPTKNASTIPDDTNKDMNPDSTVPAHLQDPLPDPILQSIQQQQQQSSFPIPTSTAAPTSTSTPDNESTKGIEPRAISTLGAWSGASLLSGLRVKGAIEIDRDRFLSAGMPSLYSLTHVSGANPGFVAAGSGIAGGSGSGIGDGTAHGYERERERERGHVAGQSVSLTGRRESSRLSMLVGGAGGGGRAGDRRSLFDASHVQGQGQGQQSQTLGHGLGVWG